MTSQTSTSRIRQSGRIAFQAGLKSTDNPFKVGSQARSLWAQGYRAERAAARTGEPNRPWSSNPNLIDTNRVNRITKAQG